MFATPTSKQSVKKVTKYDPAEEAVRYCMIALPVDGGERFPMMVDGRKITFTSPKGAKKGQEVELAFTFQGGQVLPLPLHKIDADLELGKANTPAHVTPKRVAPLPSPVPVVLDTNQPQQVKALPPPPVPIGLPSKLAFEFIGTFLLAFTVAIVASTNAALAALAIGSTLMCAIYAGGHVSSANFNPAVSLAIWVRGKLSLLHLITNIIVQLLAGLVAGLVAQYIVPVIGVPVAVSGSGYGALTVEIVLTFALCHTVLHVATTGAQANNSYYGLAIGSTVFSGALSVGGVSGGAFNPAVGCLALAKNTSFEAFMTAPDTALQGWADLFLDSVWVYAAGPMAAGLLAGLLFRLTHPSECADPHGTPLKYAREAISPYIMEFVGTYLLCFTVATAAAPSNSSTLAPLSIGAMLVAQVYAGCATSGANYNPAVTFGLWLRRAFAPWEVSDVFPLPKALGYVVMQALGAGAAGATVLYATNIHPGFPSPGKALGVAPLIAVALESIGTFFLVLVVLQTTTSAKVKGNSFYGLAIGFTLMAMGITFGPLSGGAFNPAVALLACSGASTWSGLLGVYNWVYAAGPLLGALIAALANRLIMIDEYVPPLEPRSLV